MGGLGLERGASERCLRAIWGAVSCFLSKRPGEMNSKEGPWGRNPTFLCLSFHLQGGANRSFSLKENT